MYDAKLVVAYIQHLTRLADLSKVWSRRQAGMWRTQQRNSGGSGVVRPGCWQVYFARNISGRLLLRLELLLAFGRQEEVRF